MLSMGGMRLVRVVAGVARGGEVGEAIYRYRVTVVFENWPVVPPPPSFFFPYDRSAVSVQR